MNLHNICSIDTKHRTKMFSAYKWLHQTIFAAWWCMRYLNKDERRYLPVSLINLVILLVLSSPDPPHTDSSRKLVQVWVVDWERRRFWFSLVFWREEGTLASVDLETENILLNLNWKEVADNINCAWPIILSWLIPKANKRWRWQEAVIIWLRSVENSGTSMN